MARIRPPRRGPVRDLRILSLPTKKLKRTPTSPNTILAENGNQLQAENGHYLRTES